MDKISQGMGAISQATAICIILTFIVGMRWQDGFYSELGYPWMSDYTNYLDTIKSGILIIKVFLLAGTIGWFSIWVLTNWKYEGATTTIHLCIYISSIWGSCRDTNRTKLHNRIFDFQKSISDLHHRLHNRRHTKTSIKRRNHSKLQIRPKNKSNPVLYITYSLYCNDRTLRFPKIPRSSRSAERNSYWVQKFLLRCGCKSRTLEHHRPESGQLYSRPTNLQKQHSPNKSCQQHIRIPYLPDQAYFL